MRRTCRRPFPGASPQSRLRYRYRAAASSITALDHGLREWRGGGGPGVVVSFDRGVEPQLNTENTEKAQRAQRKKKREKRKEEREKRKEKREKRKTQRTLRPPQRTQAKEAQRTQRGRRSTS